MHSGILWQVIYWSPTLALAALMVILIRRRLAREFPFFFSYIVIAWAKDLACFLVYYIAPGDEHSRIYWRPYFHTFWISHLVSALFLLLATFELSLTRLFPRFYKLRFYRYLFSAGAIFAIGLGTVAIYRSALPLLSRIVHLFDTLHVVALLFFVGLMNLMGRQWARYEFAIALGLGVNAVALVISFVVYLQSGPLHGVVRELPAIADVLTCLVWLVTFLRPGEPAAPSTAPISSEVLHQARKWEETLKESLIRKKPAS